MRKPVGLVLILFLLFPCPCFPWSGRAVGVSDGDSIRVMRWGRAKKIRLFGIDCPELGQAFGRKARHFTARMVFGKIVEVRQVDKDSYGRTVAWVSVDGRSLNKELLRAGLAWWYRHYAQDERELERLEAEARRSKIGLWCFPNPVPPWEFRRTEQP
ncbi:MAG: thermonuclease family protein [Desulfomonilaceae bacterium]